MKAHTRDPTHFDTKLCTLPSPIDTFKIYGFLAFASFCWIVWRRSYLPTRGAAIEYIELDDVATKNEENRTKNGIGGHGKAERQRCSGWRREYILGILRDWVSLCLFIAMGFFLQILGIL